MVKLGNAIWKTFPYFEVFIGTYFFYGSRLFQFVTSGLMIIARNYLDVYPYDKWNAKEIHVYQNGQTFEPTLIEMVDGETSPPNLLTEADLIALMEKHGIGE